MRLFLLPISTRRTLLYCQKIDVPATQKRSIPDWIQDKAARTWAEWEKGGYKWQKTVVYYGNRALRRIPYEEWGLKSIPPLSQRMMQVELKGDEKVDVVYPQSLIPQGKIPKILETLATEREALHRKRLLGCFIGMPLTIPVGILPVIPNIPFFYLAYRAWSHWRAIKGGQHLTFLLKNNLITLRPSPIVDAVYARQKQPLASTLEPTTLPDAELLRNEEVPGPEDPNPSGETMLLSQANGIKMTQALDLPQLEVELERAIWQVENAIKEKAGQPTEDEIKSKDEGDEKKSQ
ncbi:mitochondrial K+-H+ exchange-related-domain-containing protein [Podospora fimiseda]|uniref:Mitochondrial K+-H+ exchange-related-domain-containing protein n=1 Tax=Podospora fimiseda TaxID=252190 RepID=A0AAN7BMS8_9PEZI|nr:mitochondrial K+-H+ exchange-related-domain-containing protein [Podospora fimiseda]